MSSDSIVVLNMLTRPNYTPYCGSDIARHLPGGCHNPRTIFSVIKGQFVCPYCGWVSQHKPDIISQYKEFNNIK